MSEPYVNWAENSYQKNWAENNGGMNLILIYYIKLAHVRSLM